MQIFIDIDGDLWAKKEGKYYCIAEDYDREIEGGDIVGFSEQELQDKYGQLTELIPKIEKLELNRR